MGHETLSGPLFSDSELDEESATGTRWTAEQVGAIVPGQVQPAPLIRQGDFARVGDDIDIWDAWPIQNAGGDPAMLDGGLSLWMALGARRFPDPAERHAHARIHLFQSDGVHWTHLGPVMPDGFSPGSREWSGSAVLAEDRRGLTLYFTATGRRGEAEPSCLQRLFSAAAVLEGRPGSYRLTGWGGLAEIVERDPRFYMASDSGDGQPGTIKAFRDPAYFRDPASGAHYLFFAGSAAGSTSAFNGVIGAAVARDPAAREWRLRPPLISADTLNNELERPHAVFHGGLYYLFWSTQSHVFAPTGPGGPTGLYGMVSGRLDGGWEPVNGTGLVFANPPEAPAQAYSWLVLPDLTVISFVDNWGQLPEAGPLRFGASFAPLLRLELDGANARLAG